MKTRFPERELGKGTLGYKGETREYYDSKRGLWDVTRWVIVGVLLVLGAGFLVASASPVVDARIVSVTQDQATGLDDVVVLMPDGSQATIPAPVYAVTGVGDALQVVALPLGHVALYDGTAPGRSTGLVLLVAGACMAAYSLYRVRRPKPAVTTVLAPDDAYALRPKG
jgi:hypothetical protein